MIVRTMGSKVDPRGVSAQIGSNLECGSCSRLAGIQERKNKSRDWQKMSTKVMEGVRVLEVAQFKFTPAAGAILADWGADVIKIEHPVRGDTQRGFLNMGGVTLDQQRHTLFEHPNRGKPSIGIALATPEGQEVQIGR